MPHQNIVVGLYKLADTVGHSSHHLILAVIVHCGFVEGGGHGGVMSKAILDPLHQLSFPAGQEKFLHVHRVEGLHIHLAHRERELLPVDRHAQQTAAGDHMVLRGLFAEIFQGSQRPFTQLHFIEDHQRLFPDDGLSSDSGQQGNQIAWFNAFIKCFNQVWIGFKIEISHIFIVLFPKFQ